MSGSWRIYMNAKEASDINNLHDMYILIHWELSTLLHYVSFD